KTSAVWPQRYIPEPTAWPARWIFRIRKVCVALWSFAWRRRGVAHDLFIPAGMVTLGEFERDVTANHTAKCSALREHAHINVNQKVCDRGECRYRMQKDRHISQPAQIPGNFFREPENRPRQQQNNCTVKETPKERFLSRVVTAS